MLQRSLSSPVETDGRHQQLEGRSSPVQCDRTTSCSTQDLPASLSAPWVRPLLDEDIPAQPRWVQEHGEEVSLWEDEGGLLVTPPSCPQQSNGKGLRLRVVHGSTDQLRSMGDEGSSYRTEENKVPDGQQDYIIQEEHILNWSDLSAEGESDVIAKLVHSKNCLKKMNAELQESVDMTEDSNAILRSENCMLRDQIKGMKQAIHEAKLLMDELEEARSSLTEQAKANGLLETSLRQLEKENEMLKDQLESLTIEMSNTSSRQVDKEKIMHLSSVLRDLQQEMEETRLTLEQKEEVIHKKDFQIEQLESSQTEYSLIVQDLKEKLKDLEDQLAEALIAGEGSFQDLDGTFSPPTQHRVSLGEELMLLQAVMVQEPSKEEKDVVETASDPSLPKQSWWERKFGRLRRGMHVVGVLSLPLLLPLGLASAIVPMYYDKPGLSCVEILWSAAHRLIQPYCSVHHIGLPPI